MAEIPWHTGALAHIVRTIPVIPVILVGVVAIKQFPEFQISLCITTPNRLSSLLFKGSQGKRRKRSRSSTDVHKIQMLLLQPQAP